MTTSWECNYFPLHNSVSSTLKFNTYIFSLIFGSRFLVICFCTHSPAMDRLLVGNRLLTAKQVESYTGYSLSILQSFVSDAGGGLSLSSVIMLASIGHRSSTYAAAAADFNTTYDIVREKVKLLREYLPYMRGMEPDYRFQCMSDIFPRVTAVCDGTAAPTKGAPSLIGHKGKAYMWMVYTALDGRFLWADGPYDGNHHDAANVKSGGEPFGHYKWEVFLGDSGFSSLPHFFTPHSTVAINKDLQEGDPTKWMVNKALIPIRGHIERGFGVWKRHKILKVNHFSKYAHQTLVMLLAHLEGWRTKLHPLFQVLRKHDGRSNKLSQVPCDCNMDDGNADGQAAQTMAREQREKAFHDGVEMFAPPITSKPPAHQRKVGFKGLISMEKTKRRMLVVVEKKAWTSLQKKLITSLQRTVAAKNRKSKKQ